MRHPEHIFTIYDALTDKTILRDKSSSDVHELIGMHPASISKYVLTGNIYKNRYYLTSKVIQPEKKSQKVRPDFISKQKRPGDEDFMKRFTEAMDYLKTHYSRERLSRIHFKAVGA